MNWSHHQRVSDNVKCSLLSDNLSAISNAPPSKIFLKTKMSVHEVRFYRTELGKSLEIMSPGNISLGVFFVSKDK